MRVFLSRLQPSGGTKAAIPIDATLTSTEKLKLKSTVDDYSLNRLNGHGEVDLWLF